MRAVALISRRNVDSCDAPLITAFTPTAAITPEGWVCVGGGVAVSSGNLTAPPGVHELAPPFEAVVAPGAVDG